MAAVITPELFTDTAFQTQMEAVYQIPDLQIVGSVGRKAVMMSYGADGSGLSPRRVTGEYRDLDVMSHSMSMDEIRPPKSAISPYKLDLGMGTWLKATANGLWLTYPSDESVAEEVRPEVFTSVERQIGDLTCRTYAMTTMQKVNRLPQIVRRKDKVAFREYDTFVDTLPEDARIVEDVPLAEEFYAPFTRFSRGLHQKYGAYLFIRQRGVAINNLPPGLRKAIKAAGSPVKRIAAPRSLR